MVFRRVLFRSVVLEKLVALGAGIQRLEMVTGDFKRLVDALLDRYRRHHDHKLGEAETFVQLEYGAQIDIGLTGAGFHLNGEVARSRRRRWQTVTQLDSPQVVADLVVKKGRAITNDALTGQMQAV